MAGGARSKTNGKVVLILMCVIIVILLGWYYLFYTPKTLNISNLVLDIETKQNEVDLLDIQVIKQTIMLQEIEHLKTINPAVPAYDNYKSLATVLDVILAQVNGFDVTFADPVFTDSSAPGVKTARRNLIITYQAPTYEAAKEVIANIQDVPFRLQISDLNIAMKRKASQVYSIEAVVEEITNDSLGDSPVDVTLSVTFFENQYS